jgi:hypothetical protein
MGSIQRKGELLPGITAIIAFFVGMSFRHVLPAFVAALALCNRPVCRRMYRP